MLPRQPGHLTTDKVLLTTLCKAEKMQYDRLLTKFWNDSNDLQIHTSNHLLLRNGDQPIYRMNVEVETGSASGPAFEETMNQRIPSVAPKILIAEETQWFELELCTSLSQKEHSEKQMDKKVNQME